MADKNVIIKQKLENEIVDFYPKTKSNIVVNESTNVTGNTITDVFNNALPIKAGEHISINPSDTGIQIDFTGSLAPNVTVKGVDGNPILVSGGLDEEKTSAEYTVSHFTAGPTGGYTSDNTTTAIVPGDTEKIIKIPQLTVDSYGHVTKAADENIKITIPSTTNMVTGTGLTDNKIILGNGNSTVKTSSYGISNDSTNSTNKDTTIWTQSAVETLINNKITEGAQYLGLVNGFNNDGTLKLNNSGPIIPNSQGDWARVVQQINNAPFFVDGSGATISDTAHIGDILIYHGTSNSKYLWDVIHTEVDTDTWRPIQVGTTTLNDSSTPLIISGASGITTALSGGTLTLTGTTYDISQNANAKNKFTLTSSSGASTEIEINNVASAESAKKVANTLTIKLNNGTTEDDNQFTYNGSTAKSINITSDKIGAAPSSHSHGNITAMGMMTTTVTSIKDCKIVITDSSNIIKCSAIKFDGTTTNTALTPSGDWVSFLQANQNITINSGLKHKNQPSDPPVYIKGTASGTEPTLGKSGISAGIYSTVEVNEQGIAIAGSQVIKYYASGTTNDTIKGDAMLASGGFAFVEI